MRHATGSATSDATASGDSGSGRYWGSRNDHDWSWASHDDWGRYGFHDHGLGCCVNDDGGGRALCDESKGG